MYMPDNIETAAVTAAIENIADYRLLYGVTDNNVNNNPMNSSVSGEQIPEATENDSTDTSLNELTGNVLKASEMETLPTSTTDNHITESPPSPLSGEQEHYENKNTAVEMDIQNKLTPDTTLNSTAEMVDNSKTDELFEPNEKLLGVTKPGNGVTPTVNPIPDTTVNATEEPMDVDNNNELTEANEALHGITETGNGIMIPLHGITDLNVLDRSYSRQSTDCSVINPDYYATTKDEDNAIEGLLQLSAADNPLVEFLGDNSQLLPIGVYTPDATPTDINIETAAVTAAIENIVLEETVTKTTQG